MTAKPSPSTRLKLGANGTHTPSPPHIHKLLHSLFQTQTYCTFLTQSDPDRIDSLLKQKSSLLYQLNQIPDTFWNSSMIEIHKIVDFFLVYIHSRAHSFCFVIYPQSQKGVLCAFNQSSDKNLFKLVSLHVKSWLKNHLDCQSHPLYLHNNPEIVSLCFNQCFSFAKQHPISLSFCKTIELSLKLPSKIESEGLGSTKLSFDKKGIASFLSCISNKVPASAIATSTVNTLFRTKFTPNDIFSFRGPFMNVNSNNLYLVQSFDDIERSVRFCIEILLSL